MKTILIHLVLFIVTSSYAQESVAYEHVKNTNRYVNKNTLTIFKFEAYAASGSILFGVAKSYERAQWIVNDFTKRNRKNKYVPITSIIKQSVTTDLSYFRKYDLLFPKGYKLLYPYDLIAYRILKVEGKPQAITYIEQAREFTYDEAIEYVNVLKEEYVKYRIGY